MARQPSRLPDRYHVPVRAPVSKFSKTLKTVNFYVQILLTKGSFKEESIDYRELWDKNSLLAGDRRIFKSQIYPRLIEPIVRSNPPVSIWIRFWCPTEASTSKLDQLAWLLLQCLCLKILRLLFSVYFFNEFGLNFKYLPYSWQKKTGIINKYAINYWNWGSSIRRIVELGWNPEIYISHKRILWAWYGPEKYTDFS